VHTGVHVTAVFFFLASGWSAYLWCSRLPLPHGKAIRALAGLVLWEALQLLPVQVLAALQIAGLIGGVTVFGIAALQGVLLVASLAWAFTHPPSGSARREAGDRQPWPRYLLGVAAVLGCSYIVFALDLFTSFPSGSDATAYHLPLALHWLQTGSLAIPASRAWRFSLPGNTEIGMMVLLATGVESSVVLVNWIALVVLTLATYLLAERISDGKQRVAATVTLLMLSIPMVEFQAFSAYVDLFGTAFLLAAFALFVNHKGKQEDGTTGAGFLAVVFLSAVACGISLGTKPIYDLYGAAYAAFALFSLCRDSGGKRAALLAAASWICVGLLLPSAFWFGRGWQATRNPVFPMRVAVGLHVLLPGYAPSEITDPNFGQNFVRSRGEWLLYPWTEWKRNPGYLMIPYGEGSGLGAAFASLVPVGIAFLTYRICMYRSGNRRELLLLVVLAVFALAWWFVLHRLPRFGLPILVLACLLAAPLVAVLQSNRERAFQILLVSAVIATCSISSFVPFHALLGRVRNHRWARADFYQYPALLDRLPSGSCVLNETKLEEKNFALAGKGLRICVVPGFEAPAAVTADFLRQHGVGFVAEIVPPHEEHADAHAAPGTSLVWEEVVETGEGHVRWRLWKVGNP
jgi:hypothetical protein